MSMQQKQIRAISFVVVAFLVVGGFALRSHSRAVRYQIYLANSQHHAFAELSTAVSELHMALEKSQYTTSPSTLSALCTQMYGRAVAAQLALGELPYANVELEQTAAFVAQVGDYAMALSRSTAGENFSTQTCLPQLANLSTATASLTNILQDIQSDLYCGVLMLDDVSTVQARLASATEEGDGVDVPGGSAFQRVETDFPEIPTLIYDGPFSQHLSDASPTTLEGLSMVPQDEARAAAAQILALPPSAFTLTAVGEGALPTFGFTTALDGGELYVEVTQQGGKVLNLFSSRQVDTATISEKSAREIALQFLTQQGYPTMAESYATNLGNVITINYAAIQDGVVCYPDLVKVSVALDTGHIIGYECRGFLTHHQVRENLTPTISQTMAVEIVAPSLTPMAYQLALIPTAGGHEVLTHEFKCATPEGNHIIVYVNATTGLEEKILILLEDESGTLAM